jgi:hypothetical protein
MSDVMLLTDRTIGVKRAQPRMALNAQDGMPIGQNSVKNKKERWFV